MTKYAGDPYRAEREEAYNEGYTAGLADRSVASLDSAVLIAAMSDTALIAALSDLVAAVGELPENGHGTTQGHDLNAAYSRAVDVLAKVRGDK